MANRWRDTGTWEEEGAQSQSWYEMSKPSLMGTYSQQQSGRQQQQSRQQQQPVQQQPRRQQLSAYEHLSGGYRDEDENQTFQDSHPNNNRMSDYATQSYGGEDYYSLDTSTDLHTSTGNMDRSHSTRNQNRRGARRGGQQYQRSDDKYDRGGADTSVGDGWGGSRADDWYTQSDNQRSTAVNKGRSSSNRDDWGTVAEQGSRRNTAMGGESYSTSGGRDWSGHLGGNYNKFDEGGNRRDDWNTQSPPGRGRGGNRNSSYTGRNNKNLGKTRWGNQQDTGEDNWDQTRGKQKSGVRESWGQTAGGRRNMSPEGRQTNMNRGKPTATKVNRNQGNRNQGFANSSMDGGKGFGRGVMSSSGGSERREPFRKDLVRQSKMQVQTEGEATEIVLKTKFCCKICPKVWVTNEDHFKAHIFGKKHLANKNILMTTQGDRFRFQHPTPDEPDITTSYVPMRVKPFNQPAENSAAGVASAAPGGPQKKASMSHAAKLLLTMGSMNRQTTGSQNQGASRAPQNTAFQQQSVQQQRGVNWQQQQQQQQHPAQPLMSQKTGWNAKPNLRQQARQNVSQGNIQQAPEPKPTPKQPSRLEVMGKMLESLGIKNEKQLGDLVVAAVKNSKRQEAPAPAPAPPRRQEPQMTGVYTSDILTRSPPVHPLRTLHSPPIEPLIHQQSKPGLLERPRPALLSQPPEPHQDEAKRLTQLEEQNFSVSREEVEIAQQLGEASGISNMTVLLQGVKLVKDLGPDGLQNLAQIDEMFKAYSSGMISLHELTHNLPSTVADLISSGDIGMELLQALLQNAGSDMGPTDMQAKPLVPNYPRASVPQGRVDRPGARNTRGGGGNQTRARPNQGSQRPTRLSQKPNLGAQKRAHNPTGDEPQAKRPNQPKQGGGPGRNDGNRGTQQSWTAKQQGNARRRGKRAGRGGKLSQNVPKIDLSSIDIKSAVEALKEAARSAHD